MACVKLSRKFNHQLMPNTISNTRLVSNVRLLDFYTPSSLPVGTFTDGTAIEQYTVQLSFEQDITKVPGDLSNFLAYIPVSQVIANTTAAEQAEMNNDGSDVRACFINDTAQVPVYASGVNMSAGEGGFFIRCSGTFSSTVAQKVYLYWGNPSATALLPGDTNGRNDVFQDYEAFWGFEQDPSGSAPQLTDLTGNWNDGTSAGSMTSGDEVAGKVGNGWDLEGAQNQTIEVGVLSKSYTNGTRPAVSIGFWYRWDGDDADDAVIGLWSSDDANGFNTNPAIGHTHNNLGRLNFVTQSTSNTFTNASANGVIIPNQHHHIVGTLQNVGTAWQRSYVDGVKVAEETFLPIYNLGATENWRISGWKLSLTDRYSEGIYSIFYVRDETLQADYIATEHANQNSPSTFWNTFNTKNQI